MVTGTTEIKAKTGSVWPQTSRGAQLGLRGHPTGAKWETRAWHLRT